MIQFFKDLMERYFDNASELAEYQSRVWYR